MIEFKYQDQLFHCHIWRSGGLSIRRLKAYSSYYETEIIDIKIDKNYRYISSSVDEDWLYLELKNNIDLYLGALNKAKKLMSLL